MKTAPTPTFHELYFMSRKQLYRFLGYIEEKKEP